MMVTLALPALPVAFVVGAKMASRPNCSRGAHGAFRMALVRALCLTVRQLSLCQYRQGFGQMCTLQVAWFAR